MLITSNGRELEVRELGPIVYRLQARRVPIKCHGAHILDDSAARELCRALAAVQSEDARDLLG